MFFCVRSAARYEGITDTFVQLFPTRSAGLMTRVQGAVEMERYGKEQDSNCYGSTARNWRGARRYSSENGIAEISDIVDAVQYLSSARQVSGEVLHVDGGAHSGRWQR